MSKKLILLLGAILVLLGVSGSWVLFFDKAGTKSPVGEVIQQLIPKTKGEKLFEDEAGFSFKHPQNTDVTDKTPGDTDYYSLLELTSSEAEGKLIISVRDTQFEKVSEWADEQLRTGTLVGAISLGNIPANQYSIVEGGEKLQVTVAARDGVLYEITNPQDNGFWEDVVNLIVSTFVSVQTSVSSADTGSGEDVIYEEEEVVE